MSKKDNMIPLNQPELLKVLASLYANKDEVLVWQTESENRRVMRYGTIDSVNATQKTLTVVSHQEEFTLIEEIPVYVYAVVGDRVSVLKTTLLRSEGKKVVLGIPEQMMIRDTRKDERVHVLGQGVPLMFSPSRKEEFAPEHEFLRAEVVDLSPRGLAFKGAASSAYGLQKGDRIWMRLGSDATVTVGEVRHVAKNKLDGYGEFLQIGVSFRL